MPDIPIITLKQLSKRPALTHLLDAYPAPKQQEAILKQLLEPPIVNELPRLIDIEKLVKRFPKYHNLIAQKLLTPTMLQSFSQGEKGVAVIATLVQAFPNKKDEIAVKILHLDTFKILVQSLADLEALIDVFEHYELQHKNDIAHRVFHNELLQALATSPASLQPLFDLFPELPDYRTLLEPQVQELNQARFKERFFSPSPSPTAEPILKKTVAKDKDKDQEPDIDPKSPK
ncbi:MAG: hypothetical protein A3F46_00665 [Legionellales bacterium RIFCSPHIGHO2_12_FULL_42_9]|nr:MAG: hypothetical protein A3F46_00665 [Legionellales bacterium RIFCSPHIGHO2_12_FULL_42_9]